MRMVHVTLGSSATTVPPLPVPEDPPTLVVAQAPEDASGSGVGLGASFPPAGWINRGPPSNMHAPPPAALPPMPPFHASEIAHPPPSSLSARRGTQISVHVEPTGVSSNDNQAPAPAVPFSLRGESDFSEGSFNASTRATSAVAPELEAGDDDPTRDPTRFFDRPAHVTAGASGVYERTPSRRSCCYRAVVAVVRSARESLESAREALRAYRLHLRTPRGDRNVAHYKRTCGSLCRPLATRFVVGIICIVLIGALVAFTDVVPTVRQYVVRVVATEADRVVWEEEAEKCIMRMEIPRPWLPRETCGAVYGRTICLRAQASADDADHHAPLVVRDPVVQYMSTERQKVNELAYCAAAGVKPTPAAHPTTVGILHQQHTGKKAYAVYAPPLGMCMNHLIELQRDPLRFGCTKQ